MSFSIIRTKVGTSIGSTTLSIGSVSAFTAGNLVVISIRVITSTASITSITDDKGNVYTKAQGPITNTTSDVQDYQYYGIQIIGGATTIIITFDASVTSSGYASEFNGGGPFDKAASATGASGTSGSASISPTNAGELVVGHLDARNTVTGVTASAGYTLHASTNAQAIEYNLSATTSETPGFSWTNSVVWNILASAFNSTSTSTSFSSSTSTSLSTSSTSMSSTSSSISSTSSSISTSTTTALSIDKPTGFIKNQPLTTTPVTGDATLVDDPAALVDSPTALVGGPSAISEGIKAKAVPLVPRPQIRIQR